MAVEITVPMCACRICRSAIKPIPVVGHADGVKVVKVRLDRDEFQGTMAATLRCVMLTNVLVRIHPYVKRNDCLGLTYFA